MFGSLGLPEILLILVLALLIFGPKRLPEVGRTIGKGLSEFRRASSELKRTVNAELALDEDERTPSSRRLELGGAFERPAAPAAPAAAAVAAAAEPADQPPAPEGTTPRAPGTPEPAPEPAAEGPGPGPDLGPESAEPAAAIATPTPDASDASDAADAADGER